MLTYFTLVVIGIATLLWASVVRERRRQQSDAEHLRRHVIWLDRKGGGQ
jgi:hypothetical protein